MELFTKQLEKFIKFIKSEYIVTLEFHDYGNTLRIDVFYRTMFGQALKSFYFRLSES